MTFPSRLSAPRPAPFSLFFAICLWGIFQRPGLADEIERVQIRDSDFVAVREAVIEAIESEGLIVGSLLPVDNMLLRTRPHGRELPYRQALIVQFCSSQRVWQLLAEDAGNLVLCPLSLALYAPAEHSEHLADQIVLAWRTPGRSTPARAAVDDLLRRLVRRSEELARLR